MLHNNSGTGSPLSYKTLLLGFAAALLVSACQKDECRLNSDCPSPYYCEEGYCVAECRVDRDCKDNERCEEGLCKDRESRQRLCTSTRDCDIGETCSGGVCGKVSFVPTPSPDAGMMSQPDAGFPADSGTSPNPDAGTQPGPDAGTSMGLPYGSVCTAASQCASNYCLGPQGATQGRCTQMCSADTDCFYPDVCQDVPGAGKFCAASQSGIPVGSPCPNGPTECASGLCLALPGRTPICTQQCAPLPSCPQGLTCQPVPDGQGGSVAVCIEGMGGGFGEACTAASQCATNLCVGVNGSGQGICTAPCDTIPCPQGYSCASVQGGSGVSRVCAPDGAVSGGFGAACTGASSCNSGLCLHDQRTGGAFCTQPCNSHADCSAISGLACVVLPGGAQVCGPL